MKKNGILDTSSHGLVLLLAQLEGYVNKVLPGKKPELGCHNRTAGKEHNAEGNDSEMRWDVMKSRSCAMKIVDASK